MRPALIATDLDGTLLHPDHTIAPRNLAALRHAHELGVPLVVITGRPVRWLADISDLLPMRPHVICSNGAVRLVQGSVDAVSIAHLVPRAIALDVVADVRAELPRLQIGVEMGTRWGREDSFPVRDDNLVADVIAPYPELLREPVVKLLLMSDELASDALAARLMPIIGDRLSATWSMGGRLGLLEVCAPGVTKASALLELCAEIGVDPREAVAFGDMPNDAEMLAAVGHGYVMANGHQTLIDAGFQVAPHHADAGVGQVIERVLAEGLPG